MAEQEVERKAAEQTDVVDTKPNAPAVVAPPDVADTSVFSLKDFFRAEKTIKVMLHLALIVSLLALSLLINFAFNSSARALSQEWVANLRPGRRDAGDPNASEPKERILRPAIEMQEAEKVRMQNQLDDIRKKAKHHLDVAISYYSNFYMAIMTFSIFAGIGAICLVIITKKGLDKVNEYIVTTFLVATAIALYYQAFPGVFQQRKNVDDNRALYIKYVNLEDDVISYNTTGSIAVIQAPPLTDSRVTTAAPSTNSNSGNSAAPARPVTIGNQYAIVKLTPGEFIHYIDYQLKTYNDIAIGFDESKAASFAKEQFNVQ